MQQDSQMSTKEVRLMDEHKVIRLTEMSSKAG